MIELEKLLMKRDHVLVVRLKHEEYHAFYRAANNAGATRSRVLRKLIREFIGTGPDLLKEELGVFRQGVQQLVAVGRNLNQMVKLMHQGETPHDAKILELLGSLKAVLGTLAERLKEIILTSRKRGIIRVIP